MSLKCSGLYLAQYSSTSPHLLASGDGSKTATISGDVYIHPSAKVHPTAKVGIFGYTYKITCYDYYIYVINFMVG